VQILSSDVLQEVAQDAGQWTEEAIRIASNGGEVEPGWFLDFMDHEEGTSGLLIHVDGKVYGIAATTVGPAPNRAEAREGIREVAKALIADDGREVTTDDGGISLATYGETCV
jgi:hypothetical protein